MTLNEWLKAGNPAFSHAVEYGLYRALGRDFKALGGMKLADIYLIPEIGETAKREHDRWRKTVYLKVVKSPGTISNLKGKGYAIATRKNSGAKGYISDQLDRVCVYDSVEAAEREISDILKLYDGYERD